MTDSAKEILMERMQENLKILRLKCEFSQEELAVLVGVSRHTIMALEGKKRQMSWSAFMALILIFSHNDEAFTMLKMFDIYTEELELALKNINL